MSLYQKIKSAITVRQVGEMYGMEPVYPDPEKGRQRYTDRYCAARECHQLCSGLDGKPQRLCNGIRWQGDRQQGGHLHGDRHRRR